MDISIKDDDDAVASLLNQFEIVREFIADLEAKFEEAERAVAQPKPNADKLKQILNSAMIIVIQMKSYCP